MGSMSRRKGAVVEREIISVLNLFFGCDIKRELEQYRTEAQSDTTEGLPLSIEIKARAKPPGVQKFLDEAVAAQRPGTYPIAIIKANNKPPIVTLTLADFLQLVEPYVREWMIIEESKKNSVVELPDLPATISGFGDIKHRGSRRVEE